MPPPSPRLEHKLIAMLGGACLALLAAFGWLLATRDVTGRVTAVELQALAEDPAIRADVLRELTGLLGAWDAHPDPDVGRVLLPRLQDKALHGVAVSSNRFGLRERDFAVPKPSGTTRVVLLGDSYVFGYGVAAEDRLGVQLERILRERSGAERPIEVLHVAVSSWNITAACSFLRRQLSAIEPDLVVHVTVYNDLDDVSGVRGFGAIARFSPRRRDRGDGLVSGAHPAAMLGFPVHNRLTVGLDHESRARYREATRSIERLRVALQARGVDYCTIGQWLEHTPFAREQLASGLPARARVFVRETWARSVDNRRSADDMHWNATGMAAVARAAYELIRTNGFLAELGLEPWDAARTAFDAVFEPAADARSAVDARARFTAELRAELDFTSLDAVTASHVYGGIDRDGLVAPYASLILRARGGGGGRRVRVRGRSLDRSEIDGARVSVDIDGETVGTFTIDHARPIDAAWPLPSAVADREFVTVAFRSSDWLYADELTQQLRAFRLEQVGIEP